MCKWQKTNFTDLLMFLRTIFIAILMLLSLAILGFLLLACCNMVVPGTIFKISKERDSLYVFKELNIDAPSSINNVCIYKKQIGKYKIVNADSLQSTVAEIKAHIQLIEKSQDTLINDMRQEVNNTLEKINAWLAFWIAILSVLCAIVPIVLQYKIAIENKQKFNEEYKKITKYIKHIDFSNNTSLLYCSLLIFRNQYIQEGDERMKVIIGILKNAINLTKDTITASYKRDNRCLDDKDRYILTGLLVNIMEVLNNMTIINPRRDHIKRINVNKKKLEEILTELYKDDYDLGKLRTKLLKECDDLLTQL